jgi:hypothetical protein
VGRRIIIALLLGVATTAHAQRIPGAPRGGVAAEPGYWVGLSYGYVDGMTVNDRGTGADWRLGYSSQIDRAVQFP